jgi:hypothetical protein
VLEPYIVSGPNEQGEYRARCPLHPDTRPSAYFNFDKGVYHCKSGCNGGTLAELAYIVQQREEDFSSNVRSIQEHKDKKVGRKPQLNDAMISGWHQALLSDTERLQWLREARGLSEEVIRQYQIGWDRSKHRYMIPIYDASGQPQNVRRYKPDTTDTGLKMFNWSGWGTPARIYPIDQLDNDPLLIVEGELDALACISNGVAAVSGTHGADTWLKEWSKLFVGKQMYVSYDNDKDGRQGARRVVNTLKAHVTSIAILPPLMKEAKSDVSDWFVRGNGTGARLRELMAQAAPEAAQEPEPEVRAIRVIDSLDARTNGKHLSMVCTITGRKNPPFDLPHKVEATCTMDWGDKCRLCPMSADHEGSFTLELPSSGPKVLETALLLDIKDSQVNSLLRKRIGVPPRCPKLELKIKDSMSVEELWVINPIDSQGGSGDNTMRRVYNFTEHETPANTTAQIVGTTGPNPKDQRIEFYGWELTQATTSIDKFRMTPDIMKQLRKFQPARGELPIDKCRDIAQDLSASVTHIYGRDRMHMAMDLVYHSVLQFPMGGKVLTRGWLEFIVVGDTRTGKSETAIRLADYYGLGRVVGCEGVTFAGLVGAVKQVGNEWTVQWGEITINDRRLIVLDEASGLSQDMISQLSDIRSRGVAQLTKVEKLETMARCRLIWISNPRKLRGGVDERLVDGVDIIESLIGNPEDIARFDFAMSVRTEDVPMGEINNPDHIVTDPFYDADACRNLILWAWSRKAEQVHWEGDSYRLIYKAAEWLGKRYIPSPPLVQGTNVREKVARIAVAIAARTFSTDASGELVLVREQHVRDAVNFLDRLYTYENFGYRRMSQRIFKNRETARKNKDKIKRWLLEHERVLEFLLDKHGSFRAQDLEEMGYMSKEEVNYVLGTLSDAKMIAKDRAQIVLEPELQTLLKEFS